MTKIDPIQIVDIHSLINPNLQSFLASERVALQIKKQNELIASAAKLYSPYMESINTTFLQAALALDSVAFRPPEILIEQITSSIKIVEEAISLSNVHKSAFAIAEAWKQNFDHSVAMQAVKDFRIDVLSQQIQNDLSSLSSEDIQTIDIQFDYHLVESDESFSESFVDTEDDSEQSQNVEKLKELIIELTEELRITRNQRENPSQENIGTEIQNSNTADFFQGKFIPFINTFLIVVGVINSPKEIYELLQWFASLLEHFIK